MSVFRRFLTRWQNILALLIIGFFVFVALAAPWLSPQEDPENPSPYRIYSGTNRSSLGKRVPQPPDGDIPLGTAPQGLDIYHAMVWGTGPALRFGLIVALSSAVSSVKGITIPTPPAVGILSAAGQPQLPLTLAVDDVNMLWFYGSVNADGVAVSWRR